MKKLTSLLILMILSSSVLFAQMHTPEQIAQKKMIANGIKPVMSIVDADINAVINPHATSVTDDLFDPQFDFICGDASGEAGVETNGEYIYTSKWNGDGFFCYEMDGTFLGAFPVPGEAAVRDLAYDGTYFYGAAASTQLFEMDFVGQSGTLISTLTAAVATRACGYNPDYDAFYGNNWSDPITLYDRTGGILNQFNCGAYESYYGFAYVAPSDDGPWLYGFAQAGGASQAVIVQIDPETGAETGVTFDAIGYSTTGAGIAGGLAAFDTYAPGWWTILGILQNETIFLVEGGMAGPPPDLDLKLTGISEPNSGFNMGVEDIVIGVKNVGAITQSNFDVQYRVDGGAWYTEMIAGPLAMGESIVYTFATPYDFSAFGFYYIEAEVILAGDENPDNNSGDKTIENMDASQFCFYSITMWDSYGDGWNGNYVQIFGDGVEFVNATLASGTGPETIEFLVQDGAFLTAVWTGTAWPEECTYEVYDADGDLIFADGPNPTGGDIGYASCEPPEEIDGGTVAILSPVSGMLLGIEPVTAVFKNFGLDPLPEIPVGFNLDGAGWVNEIVPGPVGPGAEVEYTFAATVDLTELGTYFLEVCTFVVGDEDPLNDCMDAEIENSAGIYCPASTVYEDEWIAFVDFGTIQNASGWQGLVADYTDQFNIVEVGVAAEMIVTNGNAWASDLVTVWVDWNDNFEFDADEAFVLASDGTGLTFTGDIIAPAIAEAGEHRMRVRMTYSTAPEPCFESSYGEVEDYTIVVAGNNCENFDDLTVGGLVAEQLGDPWTTWSGTTADDATVSDMYSYSPDNSFVVDAGVVDLVLKFGDTPLDAGVWTYSHYIYVPSGFSGYFNVQSDPTPGIGWVLEVYFDDGGTGSFAGQAAGTFTYNQDTWIMVEIVLDLDTDNSWVYFDGVLVNEFVNIMTIGGIDYFGADTGGAPGAYYDDVCFDEGEPELFPVITVDPISMDQTLEAGEVATQTLFIGNEGDAELVFTLDVDAGVSVDVVIVPEYPAVDKSLVSSVKTVPSVGNMTNSDDVILMYDDGINDDAIGLTAGGDFMVAAYWPAATMGQYAGMSLSEVEVYMNDIGSIAFTLTIWDVGSATAPGAILYEQAFTPLFSDWYTVVLDVPVLLSGNDIWVGYTIVGQMAGEYPAGCDAGPAVAGFGDMITLDGVTWAPLSGYGLDFNWNIHTKVVGEVITPWLSADPLGGTVPVGGTAEITVTFNAEDAVQGEFYEGAIAILSNDPVTPEVIIPVTMTVGGCEPYFEFEGGDPSSPLWTIYIGGATLEENDLGAGDQIAIFDGDIMVGLFDLDQVCTPENQFENDLTAFSVLTTQPGYQAGNDFSFKCWDCSEQVMADFFLYEFFDPYGDAYTGDVFPAADGEYSVAAIDFMSIVCQTFDLSLGFQFISSAVDPGDPDMTVVMADVLNDNLDFVRNSAGQMLRKIGPTWVNGIGDWMFAEGYLVKMFAPDSFTIFGSPVPVGCPIDVELGFQFVSYFPAEGMDALMAFETIVGDDLDFIRDSQGQMLRKIGPVWVNGIGDAMPGQGYLVKMFAPGQIIYPEPMKLSGKTTINPSHLIFDGGNAAEPVYTMYINGLEIGDEVAAYNGNGILGSMTVTSDNAYNNALPVFSELTNGTGYVTGEPISLKVWSNDDVVIAEFEMESVYNSYVSNVYPSNDGEFSVVNITKGATLSGELVVYPNPATNMINISSPNQINNVVIFNYVGQSVYEGNSTKINTSNFESGVYIIRIETTNGIETQKVTIR